MQYLPRVSVGLLLAIIIVISACTRGIEFGDDLLSDELVDVTVTDTFVLNSRTVVHDSTRVFSATARPLRQLVGKMEDPIFGRSEAMSHFQLGINPNDNASERFPGATLDSITLNIAWDTAVFYGNYRDGMELEVRELMEPLDEDLMDHFAGEMPAVFPDAIGSTGPIVPSADDRYVYRRVFQSADSSVVTVDTLVGVRSIRLDDALGQRILDSDASVFSSRAAFRDAFPGLRIEAVGASNGHIGYRLSSLIEVNLYYQYTDTAGVDRQGLYPINLSETCNNGGTGEIFTCVLYNTYEHDYTGSQVEPFLTDPLLGDSLLFLQSMIGTNIELDLPTRIAEGQILLNKAQLLLELEEQSATEDRLYPPVQRVLALYRDSEGETFIRDLLVAGSQGFRGFLEEDTDTGRRFYELNITEHMQSVLQGELPERLIIVPNQRSSIPSRTVIKGNKASTGAVRLIVVYSEL